MYNFTMKRYRLTEIVSYTFAAVLLIVAVQMLITGEETTPFLSSELNIATFSPNGLAGGALLPASGCSGAEGGCSGGGSVEPCTITISPNPVETGEVFTLKTTNLPIISTGTICEEGYPPIKFGPAYETTHCRWYVPWYAGDNFRKDTWDIDSTGYPLGRYVVGANGGNTSCTATFEITDGVLPDLAPQPPTASPNQVKAGDSITFTTLVDNIGATTSDSYDIVFHVDVDGDGVSEYQLDDRETAITVSGGQNSEDHTETVPVGAATGTWQVGYFVDTSSEVTESDEDNNWSGWTPFEVIEEAVLIAPSVTLSGSTPVSDGGDTTLTWIIGGGTPESCTPSTEVGGVTDWDTTNTGVIGGGTSIGPYTFRRTCTNAAGTDSDDATIIVLPPVDGGAGATACIEPELVANPVVVRSGESAEITWENPDTAAICTLYENGVSTGETFGPSVCDNSNTTTVTPTNITEYSLVCTDMIAPDQVPDPITIYVTPNYDQN